jgi:hypothetical protein
LEIKIERQQRKKIYILTERRDRINVRLRREKETELIQDKKKKRKEI